MANQRITKELAQTAAEAFRAAGSKSGAAKLLDIPRSTMRHHLTVAEDLGLLASREVWDSRDDFDVEVLPEELPTAEELIARRKTEWGRYSSAKEARRLIDVKIKMEGPIAICHMGDPHVDDPGTDIGLLEEHVNIVKNTSAMYAANIGDMHNNWVGRLARLYGEQSTSQAEAWVLVEWLINSMDYLYLIKGNHDVWSGSSDPLDWMIKNPGVVESHGARINLIHPNGAETRINARHDFRGHSMWNEVHGPKKAVKMGWRDHILTCGHKHTSGIGVDKCPATGLVSHVIRCASYKVWDRYADQLGLPDGNVFPACVTIIDPDEAEDTAKRVTVIMDVENGAEYLTWLRNKKGFAGV